MATLGVKILPNRRKASGKLGIYISLTFKKKKFSTFQQRLKLMLKQNLRMVNLFS